ncbi:hypothetical protein RFI_16567 [Reticulomyxa filosa]|uniref:Uncharacterized protein n=1 Tax=Reticulomyxa filosa TaxID=46433 RepID=X6N4G0_RETFI|nr:hypothetical protein RFI_16567 [Reticulomyxa filosa]|eukprot:ETO20649.1 hypothetical protein RFI_16567 [Reticulomyxa filosa]
MQPKQLKGVAFVGLYGIFLLFLWFFWTLNPGHLLLLKQKLENLFEREEFASTRHTYVIQNENFEPLNQSHWDLDINERINKKGIFKFRRFYTIGRYQNNNVCELPNAHFFILNASELTYKK